MARELGRARGWQGPLLNPCVGGVQGRQACMRTVPNAPDPQDATSRRHGARCGLTESRSILVRNVLDTLFQFREPPCLPSHATSATLCFLFFPLPPPRCVLPQPPNLLRCLLLGHLIQNRPTISLPTEVCLCPSLWCPLWAPEHGSHCGRRREYGVQQGSVSVRKNQRFRF